MPGFACTAAALLLQKDIIIPNIEQGPLTMGLFIDFSKASDVLNRRTLLAKLERYGVRGIPLGLLDSHLKKIEKNAWSSIGVDVLSKIILVGFRSEVYWDLFSLTYILMIASRLIP